MGRLLAAFAEDGQPCRGGGFTTPRPRRECSPLWFARKVVRAADLESGTLLDALVALGGALAIPLAPRRGAAVRVTGGGTPSVLGGAMAK